MKRGVMLDTLRAKPTIVIRAVSAGPNRSAALPALIASGFRTCVLAGGGAPIRYATAYHIACWLGLTRCPAWPVAARRLPPRTLYRAAGNSTAAVFTEAVAAASTDIAHLPARTLAYASLFSGYFDTFLPAYRALGLRLRAAAAAERIASARAVLAETYNYETIYKTAMEAAHNIPTADIISWTATCVRLSAGARLGSGDKGKKKRAALALLRADTKPLILLARRCAPILIVGEQVPGLLAARSPARRLFLQLVKPIPYAWFVRKIDAADLNAPTHRRRVALVACRIDCLRISVPRSAFGCGTLCHCNLTSCPTCYPTSPHLASPSAT